MKFPISRRYIFSRKRKIKPTKEWFDENVRRDVHGEVIPILDLCTKTDSLLTLPIGRALHQRGYEIFSVHTLIDETGFTLSFQLWKSAVQQPLTPEDLVGATTDDSSGFEQQNSQSQNQE